jgi:hypothetical protein
MKKYLTVVTLACVLALPALAVEETFTTADQLDCTAISYCSQNTTDQLFTLKFAPTYPTSGPSANGFDLKQRVVEVSNAKGGLMDLNIASLTLTGSKAYNGVNFLGAVKLEVQDVNGNWTYLTQWSTYITSTKGIYVIFNGNNAQSPLVKSVRAIRFSGINGATMFRIGMLNVTAY